MALQRVAMSFSRATSTPSATPLLSSPLNIGTLQLRNRLYRAPVLEGAGEVSDPVAEYSKHFVDNAKNGVALIVQGNTIVVPEGRTSPGMSSLTTKADLTKFAPMTQAIHQAGAKIVVQLGHGGVFALESWHRRYIAQRTSKPWAPSELPLRLRLLHGGVHVLTTREVRSLAARFGEVAAWARQAGYDGVQLAGGNAKLLHQFLSRTYNRRTDEYGGTVRRRGRILEDIRRAIAERAGEDYPVLLKLSAVEESLFGNGITLEEGIEYARIAEGAGFAAITPVIADAFPNTAICRGDFPLDSFRNTRTKNMYEEAVGSRFAYLAAAVPFFLASRRYPFKPLWNHDVFRRVKQAVSIPVFAVGGIRTVDEAQSILKEGSADMIGIGRPFYAEPALANRFLEAAKQHQAAHTLCENCNRCVVSQMLGLPGVCYNPQVQAARRAAQTRVVRPVANESVSQSAQASSP